MKVLLVGNYEPDQQRSMLGFAGALLAGLCERGIETRLLSPRRVVGRFGSPHAGLGKWLGYVDKFGLFPGQLRQALTWADVVHVCDHGNAMYAKYLQGIPHVVTCHDLLAMRAARGEIAGWPTGATGRLYQRLIFRGLRQARSVVCVSETTQKDLLDVTGLPESRTSVVYNGLYHAYSPMGAGEADVLLSGLGLGPRFLLHVGGNQPYKNRLGLLKIYHALQRLDGFQDVPLALAGKPFTAEMRAFVGQHGLEGRAREMTGLTDAQLRALYSRAQALVFPSLFEGFGLPIIEAQSCGCPVFASDRAPMTEVGADAAVYFDPAQPEQAARVIANDLKNRERMKTRGLENAGRFSTQRMLDGYLQAYARAGGAA